MRRMDSTPVAHRWRALAAAALIAALSSGCGGDATNGVEVCWNMSFDYAGSVPLEGRMAYALMACDDPAFGDWREGFSADMAISASGATACSPTYGLASDTLTCTAYAWIDVDDDVWNHCHLDEDDCLPDPEDPVSDTLTVTLHVGGSVDTSFVMTDPET